MLARSANFKVKLRGDEADKKGRNLGVISFRGKMYAFHPTISTLTTSYLSHHMQCLSTGIVMSDAARILENIAITKQRAAALPHM